MMPLPNEKKTVSLFLGLTLVLSFYGLTGCAKNAGGTAGGPGAGGSAALAAAGQTVLTAHNCVRCHTIGGRGGRMGPDLSHVGADPNHTSQWLAEHVKNPRSHNASSRMPAFQGQISDSDLNALGTYLASLK